MTSKLTDKQKLTLWQQRRSVSYQASCKLDRLPLSEPQMTPEQAQERLISLRRQYGQ